MKKISVIITNYNKMPYLLYLISYFNRHQNDEVEVICINDGKMKDKIDFGKIIVVNNEENKGIGYVRQQGLDMATGEYVTFIDGDDIVVEEYIDELLKMIKTNADVYQFPYIIYPYGSVETDDIDSVFNKMYKKEFLIKNKCKFKNVRYGEDALFNEDVFFKKPFVYNIKNILYIYNYVSDGLAHCSCLKE